MKKIVFTLLLSLFATNIWAQRLQIGVYTEPQAAWISSDEQKIISNGAIVNINSGIEFDWYFMPNYVFSIGICLNNQGGNILYTDSIQFQQNTGVLDIPAGTSLKHNLQYIGIPFGLKLKTEELGYTTFYVHGGLMPLINLKASTTAQHLNLNRAGIGNEIYDFSLNYFFEAGIEYRLAGRTSVWTGLKWSAGFSDVSANDLANNNLYSLGLHLGLLF